MAASPSDGDSELPRFVLKPSARPEEGGGPGGMVIFSKLTSKVVFCVVRVCTDRIGRAVSCFDAVESCCVFSQAGDDVS